MPDTVYRCLVCKAIHESYTDAEVCERTHGLVHKYAAGQKFLHTESQTKFEIVKPYVTELHGVKKLAYTTRNVDHPETRPGKRYEVGIENEIANGYLVKIDQKKARTCAAPPTKTPTTASRVVVVYREYGRLPLGYTDMWLPLLRANSDTTPSHRHQAQLQVPKDLLAVFG